jgi:ABC-type multidrug transport system permease subunit
MFSHLDTAMMTIIELPYLFLGLLCFLLPFYWLTGLQNSGTQFFRFVLVGYLMVLFFSFMEQIYIAGLPNLIVAQAVHGFWMGLFFAFGGLFIKASAIPIGWKWFYCQ